MLLRKCAAGVRFEIFLEFKSSVFIGKCAVPHQFPRSELGSMRRFARIMFWKAPLQIRGCADVLLFGKIDAAEDVDVPHGRLREARLLQDVYQPVFAQEGYAGHASLSALAWLRHA